MLDIGQKVTNNDPNDVYKDSQDLITEDLNAAATKFLQQYIDEIKAATVNAEKATASPDPSKTNPTANWQDFVKNFIRKIFYDTFENYSIQIDRTNLGNVQFYVCGSLAKQQATPYSDFDGFIICKTQADVERINTALAGMKHLLDRIFAKTHQFSPDPTGITPFRFTGTVDTLYERLAKGEVPDAVTYLRALATARPLAGASDLLDQLMTKIAGNVKLSKQDTAEALYKSAVSDDDKNGFVGPRNKDSIHLKNDIFRPLDFIIMGLRKEYNLVSDDGALLTTPQTVMKLVELGKMSREVADLILSIFRDAMVLRFKNHLAAEAEADKITFSDDTADKTAEKLLAQSLIHRIAILRGLAAERLGLLVAGKDSQSLCFELTSLQNFPYQTTSYTRADLQEDISPYLFKDYAREFIEQQSNTLRSRVIKGGSLDNIFADLEGTPTHFNLLVEGFVNCFDDSIINEVNLNAWFNAAVQKGLNDLFDSAGNLHPWLKNILSSPSHILNPINLEDDKVKKALLTSYIDDILGRAVMASQKAGILSDTRLATIQTVNKMMRAYCFEINPDSGITISYLVNAKQDNFNRALSDFAKIVTGAIKELKSLKESEDSVEIIHKIDTRIAKYTQLAADLRYAAQPETKRISKGAFFNRAVDYFNDDLKKLKKDLPAQSLSGFAWLAKQLLDLLGIPFAFTRQEKLEEISSTASKTTQKFAFNAANNRDTFLSGHNRKGMTSTSVIERHSSALDESPPLLGLGTFRQR